MARKKQQEYKSSAKDWYSIHRVADSAETSFFSTAIPTGSENVKGVLPPGPWKLRHTAGEEDLTLRSVEEIGRVTRGILPEAAKTGGLALRTEGVMPGRPWRLSRGLPGAGAGGSAGSR